jgi:hypothetical protein
VTKAEQRQAVMALYIGANHPTFPSDGLERFCAVLAFGVSSVMCS